MAKTPRQIMIDRVRRQLGGGIIKLELDRDPQHYEDAVDIALEVYRSRSSNAVEESLAFLELQPHQTAYYLPNEVKEVRQLFRRGPTGTASGTGGYFDPFGAAWVSQYALNGGSSNQGSLVTYELFTGFQELVGRMFGLHINYTWSPTQHRLDIVRNITAPEQVLMWIYNYRPEEMLFEDDYSRPWLFRYITAVCKQRLGQARSKFGSIVGPQGGTTLNGDSLIAQGDAEIAELLEELKNNVDQNMGYGFIIG